MTLPLYRGLVPSNNALPGHTGLWYEKYCNQWRVQPPASLKWSLKAEDRQAPKTDWIKTVTTGGGHAVGGNVDALLKEQHTRLDCLCPKDYSLVQVFRTTSRLVMGIGQDHPVENGFLWHPTLGVPYLPGSSIKGMLRNWMLTWEGNDAAMPWFESAQDKGVGELIFLDALPLTVPRLEADVITPHYGPYYTDPAKAPPADWHSPLPAPFLTVAAGATFAVRVVSQRNKSDFQAVRGLLLASLTAAFDNLGIGAKTAVGYGRLTPHNGNSPPPPPSVPSLQAVDPLTQFKNFCTAFGAIASNKGKQDQLVQKLKELPPDLLAAARAHLRDRLKTKAKDCIGELKTLLFPESN
jgi:CRISPR-associated protein Cmr6